MFVVRVLKGSDVVHKSFEHKADAINWAMGSAFEEFDGHAERAELYETSADASNTNTQID
jgi:hypothetical protein